MSCIKLLYAQKWERSSVYHLVKQLHPQKIMQQKYDEESMGMQSQASSTAYLPEC